MNAKEALKNVNEYIRSGEAFKAKYGYSKKWTIATECDHLGIFDWWNDYLSVSQLKQMKKFLETAIDLGYEGYVCFKVGAAGCSHGMWAHKNESTNGYSPDGEFLFHSFRSGDNYWDAQLADGTIAGRIGCKSEWEYNELSLKEIKAIINA